MNKPIIITILSVTFTGTFCFAQDGPEPDLQKAAEQWITESTLRADIQFLSDDLFEGRQPGTRGDLLAQKYIIAQFKLAGLQPALPEPVGWTQTVPLVGVTTGSPDQLTFNTGQRSLTLQNHDDYVVSSGLPNEESSFVDVEMMFVGYGIQAPEYDWDDFKDVDVKGKFLLVMNNDPANDPEMFAGNRRLYYGRWDYKYAKAAELGAAGLFIIHTAPSAGYPYQVVQTSWSGEQMALSGATKGRLPIEGWLSEDAARKLTELAGKDLDQLRSAAESRSFRPVAIDATVSVKTNNRIRKRRTANVLGLLPGSDPKLKDQWLVITAHHDHIGMSETRDQRGDNIYNGAIDNASGVGVMLALARAMTALPPDERPKRSVLFAAVGAEEQGLLGSQYLAENPPVPAGRLAAVINIDGVNTLGPTADTVVIGRGKSDLDAAVEQIAGWQNRTVVGDRFPDKGYYYRSDQFSFAKVGVPGLYLGTGTHVIGKPDGWGEKKLQEWTDTIYHQTSDEYDPNWNLDGAIQDARLMFYVAMLVANQAVLPAWNAGDEFEAARKAALESAMNEQ